MRRDPVTGIDGDRFQPATFKEGFAKCERRRTMRALVPAMPPQIERPRDLARALAKEIPTHPVPDFFRLLDEDRIRLKFERLLRSLHVSQTADMKARDSAWSLVMDQASPATRESLWLLKRAWEQTAWAYAVAAFLIGIELDRAQQASKPKPATSRLATE
jgi:hypothetical protein